MRHVFRKRAAFTRPNFGTAIRMSITFAVDTYSGGLPRIVSIRTRPSLRSFFSFARLTRTSFARFSASMRWSSDRRGACVGVFEAGMAGRPILPTCPLRSSEGFCGELQRFFRGMRGAVFVVHPDNSELFANPRGCVGIGEQHGAERNVQRPARDELDDVMRSGDAAHADDRELRRRVARVHGRERNGFERWTGETAAAARKDWLQRVRIQSKSAKRVDQREAVRTCARNRCCDRCDV